MRPSVVLLSLLALVGPEPSRRSAAAALPLVPAGWNVRAAETGRPRSFYFTRGKYTGLGWYPSWTTDSPKADRQLLTVLHRLLPMLDLYDSFHPIDLADPELRRFPFLYCVEVGHMDLTDEEVAGLRSYLAAGGFLMVDDFWGTREWEVFERQIQRVLPGRPIVDLPLDHPIFHTYYDIQKIEQVPNGPRICRGYPTWEQDGRTPHIRGIMDDSGRLMVLIDWNSDMGDAWEWAEQSCYPLQYSTYAFQLMSNAVVYAMSH